MATANTLEELAKGVGRSLRTLHNWRRKGVKIPPKGPYDVEGIRRQAIEKGLYDRVTVRSEDESGGVSEGGKTGGTSGNVVGGQSKLKEAASVYSLKQRMANLEYTVAKTTKLTIETKAKQKDLLPRDVIHQGLMELAGDLRELAVTLLQRGNEEATAAAKMIQDRIKLFSERNDRLFGPVKE